MRRTVQAGPPINLASAVAEAATVHVSVTLPPRTKKNHGATMIHPSSAWTGWVRRAEIMVNGNLIIRVPNVGLFVGNGLKLTRKWQPLERRLNCSAIFYRDADRGDAVGYYQGLADLLEERGIVVNDSQIRSWDGSRLLKDAMNPRTEITLTEAV